MHKDSTLGLSPAKLARLLGITLDCGSGEGRRNTAQNTSELIQAHLAGTLPFDTTVIEELPAIIGRLRNDLISRGGKTLGNVLTDPKSDLDTIKKIRMNSQEQSN